VHEQDFMVQRVESLPEQNPPIKMEVGIEDCLHICFNYDRSRLCVFRRGASCVA
jgi:vacuolar protein sorting-associated protein 26